MKILHEELLSSYLFFGWIDPKGKLILPTIEDKNSSYIILHADLLDGNINDLFKQGYIRFLIEKKNPKQITYFTKNLEKVNLISFLSGMKEIENLITTNKVNPKVFPNPVPLPENHVFEYEKNNKFHEISAKTPNDLKRKIEAEKIKLTESNYTGWKLFNYIGWADQTGQVIFDWNNNFEGHSGMINYLGSTVLKDRNLNKGNARQKGYTRLVLADDRLMLNAWFEYIQEIGKENWLKLVSNIIKNTEAEIIKNEKLSLPQRIVIDISGYDKKNENEAKKYEIDAPFDSNFIRKYKAQLNQINEYFEMENYYLAWGWVDNKNKLILPTLKMKNSELNYNHTEILPTELTHKTSMKQGFIRWKVEKDKENQFMLFIECNKNLPKEDLREKIKIIENYLLKQPDPVFPEKPPYIDEYFLDYESENQIYHRIKASTPSELLRKYEENVKKESESVGITEYFPMEKYYLAWGWVDIPNHYKLILPTLKMKQSNAIFYHADIVPEEDEMTALGNKKVKWSLEKTMGTNKLFVAAHPRVSKRELMTAINVIEKFLESEKGVELFPYKSPVIGYYNIEYRDADNTTISALSKQELFNKLRNLQAALTEYYSGSSYVLAWGVLTPNNKIKPAPKGAARVDHGILIPSEYSYYGAYQNGYIFWSLIRDYDSSYLDLHFEPEFFTKDEILEKIQIIENYLKKKSLKVTLYQINLRAGVDKYIVKTKEDLISKIQTQIKESLTKSKTKLINKLKQKFELNEYFEMEDYYLVWGWARPNGTLILPSKVMKITPNVNFTHDNMLDISRKQALGMGFVRWFIEYGYGNLPKLVLNFDPSLDIFDYNTLVKIIKNIEKFLSKRPDPVFPDKPAAIFKYEADVIDTTIRSDNKNDFLRKIKDYIEKEDNEEKLNEFFGMDGFYLAWGWITPDGRLLLPTEEERDSEQSIVHLLFLQKHYPKYESILEALDDGFVRWHIERGKTFPDLWLSFMPHKIKPENLRKGIDKIQAFLKKQPDPIFRKKPEFFDKIQTTFYYYPKKDSEFYKFYSVIQLLNKVKSEKTLSEKFLHTTYLAWGIVTKKGKLIKPTLEQKNSSDFVIHSDIIPKSEGKYFSIDEYVEDGGIRWLIEKDRDGKIGLLIDVSKKIDNQKLLKITKMILDDKPDEVFPEKPLTVDYIIVFREGEEFLAKNYSHLRKMLTSNSE
jgi:hypothetical protein